MTTKIHIVRDTTGKEVETKMAFKDRIETLSLTLIEDHHFKWLNINEAEFTIY